MICDGSPSKHLPGLAQPMVAGIKSYLAAAGRDVALD
jgi:hypothetical protein